MRLYSNREWFRQVRRECRERGLCPLLLVALVDDGGPTFDRVELLRMDRIDNKAQADILEQVAAILRQNGR